jgi:mevalonate pyrophosphate decarboxylase
MEAIRISTRQTTEKLNIKEGFYLIREGNYMGCVGILIQKEGFVILKQLSQSIEGVTQVYYVVKIYEKQHYDKYHHLITESILYGEKNKEKEIEMLAMIKIFLEQSQKELIQLLDNNY